MMSVILSYLERTACFEDSVEGILNWWLAEEELQQIQERRQNIKRAVELLLAKGALTVRLSANGQILYGLPHFPQPDAHHSGN